jgi:hypothetical protein
LLSASRWFIAWFSLRPWRWKTHVPPKHRLTFNGLHDCVQKADLYVVDFADNTRVLQRPPVDGRTATLRSLRLESIVLVIGHQIA